MVNILSLIDDRFSLELVNHEQFKDAEEYFSDYLFTSEVYRIKVITLVREIISQRWTKEINSNSNGGSVGLHDAPELESLLI